ncbi:amidohydrolase family protein [Nocardioides sp.]|uniref:amidohydrolase family protein n=1 Tax=Nocardioides sp. TaxID=35761 RepID=UPI0025D28986|nr:amidohydrolase family protein [Nocardioides sp.]
MHAIDMHAHLAVPGRALVVSRARGTEVVARESPDTGTRLAAMDAMGVRIQAVSLSPSQYDDGLDPGLAREVVEIANEALAALVSTHPDRFVGIADVALAHLDLAAEQLERAVVHHGLRGVQIPGRAGQRELSAPGLEPFWAAAERLGVPVVVHPYGCSLGARLAPYSLSSTVGTPTEHAVALSHLILSGVLDRHPGLEVVATHGGGYLPLSIGRVDHAWLIRPDSRGCKDLPSSYLARLSFDSLVYRGDALRHLLDLVGADRIVLGSDYPYDVGVRDPVERLDRVPGLTAGEREAVLHRTAARLLGLADHPAGA